MRRCALQTARLSSIAALFGALAAAPAPGQGPANQDLMSMQLEDLSRVKVYSASRHLEDARTAPSSVSIITREDIRKYGWRTLADALRTLRGFYTSDNRQYTYLGERGFMRPGDDNPRILLLVNGHRLNDKVYDTAAIGTEFPLDLDLVDHIEVVRGPGSSLFGTNAIFGVINVITREPGGRAEADTTDDAGSLESRTGSAILTGGKGKVAGLLSGSLYRSAGEPSLYFPVFASPGTGNGYAENADGDHFEHAFAELRAGDFRLDGMVSDRIRQFPTGADGSVFGDPADRDNDARGYVDAELHRKLRADTDLDLRGWYDAYDYAGSGDYAEPGLPVPVAADVKGRADWLGTEATLTQQIGAQSITAGVEYEYSLDIKQWTYAAGQPDVFWSDRTPWRAGVFGEAELHFIPRLIVHAGARVDASSEFQNAVSPRAALVYTPDDRTALKYIVGKAYRDPNAYEEYYADGVTVTAGPRSLVPEQIVSHELVFERGLWPWVSVTADGFYNGLRQLIDQVPDGNTTLSYFVNDDRVHAMGLEGEVDVERESGIAARASYTATMATDDVARRALTNAPHSQAKFNASLPASRWGTAGVELLYVGALTDQRGTRVPAYFLPGITFATQPLWGGWQFSSSCYDATNQRWFSPGGPNDPEDQMQMDGRGWRVRLSYRLAARGGGGR